MSLPTKGFDLRLSKRGKNVVDNVTEAKRFVAAKALDLVLSMSPADTGLFRTNWQATTGVTASSSVARPYAPGIDLGIHETANRTQSFNVGMSVINRAPLQGGLFISNGTLYGPELDAGKSTQQPANFVHQAALGASKALMGIEILGVAGVFRRRIGAMK